MEYISLNTMNNKFSCDGPRAVPLPLDFNSVGSYSIDLTVMVQRSVITDVQGFFIDNSANDNPLTILVAIQNQTIVIPANSQAYLGALLGDPIFTVSTTPAAGLTVKMFALNFPVTNAVWNAGTAGAVSTNVNVTNAGQQTMAASIPVAIASDQSVLNTGISSFTTTALVRLSFAVTGTKIYLLAPTNVSATVAVTATSTETIRVCNYGTETAFVNPNNTTAIVGHTAIPPNTSVYFSGPSTAVSAICATTGTNLQISIGVGAPQ